LGFSFFSLKLAREELQQTILPRISGNADENKEASISERLRGLMEVSSLRLAGGRFRLILLLSLHLLEPQQTVINESRLFVKQNTKRQLTALKCLFVVVDQKILKLLK